MNTETIAFLIQQGFTPEDIDKMSGAISDQGTGEDRGSGEYQGSGEDQGPGEDQESGEDQGSGEDQAAQITELTKTVKELADTVKAIQSDNAKKAKGGKVAKKNSGDVIKDFFGSSQNI